MRDRTESCTEGLRYISEQIKEREAALAAAHRDRDNFIRYIRDQGIKIASIQDVTGLSRSRVNEILTES